MIAPRCLVLQIGANIPEVFGPPTAERNVAAPGKIVSPDPASALAEAERARPHWEGTLSWSHQSNGGLHLDVVKPSETDSSDGSSLNGSPLSSSPLSSSPLSSASIASFVGRISGNRNIPTPHPVVESKGIADFDLEDRQRRQVEQMTQFTQRLLNLSHRQRDLQWRQTDPTNLDAWTAKAAELRELVHRDLIGKLPDPTVSPNPRTRKILSEDDYIGYDVVLDVYPDIIASGILLLPTDLEPNEQRPVVVCQHGLEGTPMDTIVGPGERGFDAYKSFSVELVKRGFIVYAPQNPYRGGDAFRTLQRKSNPLGRSLFSYIIPQHLVTLRWLASLPQVDATRIGFYGLSYGGKTAMRVPPLLPPSEKDPGYALSICSADYNEWVAKNASTDTPFSYVWTPEYEIFEWNMGHLANYAELAMLMAPRPFMVERGHDDGVGVDEWVAWEYAKVRRHYGKLGLADRTEIEFFNGPHTINGQGTYRFLQHHLRWHQ
jgi:hypothetical protein